MMSEQLHKKVEQAIKLIQSASKMACEHGQELELCYSGGKDSDVILELTKMAGAPYRAIYRNTTIDPPGTIKHVQDMGVEIMRPKESFFEIIGKRGLPNKLKRFCCGYLKEYKVLDYAIVGVRREESAKRAKNYVEPEICRIYNKTGKKQKVRQYFPILEWTSQDISEFVKERNIKCHNLYYDEKGNFHAERRLGCLACPMLDKKRIEYFKRYPNLIKAYAHALRKFRTSHPNSVSTLEYKDEYEHIARDVFYWRKTNKEWEYMKQNCITPPNYKELLENYFNIKF